MHSHGTQREMKLERKMKARRAAGLGKEKDLKDCIEPTLKYVEQPLIRSKSELVTRMKQNNVHTQ